MTSALYYYINDGEVAPFLPTRTKQAFISVSVIWCRFQNTLFWLSFCPVHLLILSTDGSDFHVLILVTSTHGKNKIRKLFWPGLPFCSFLLAFCPGCFFFSAPGISPSGFTCMCGHHPLHCCIVFPYRYTPSLALCVMFACLFCVLFLIAHWACMNSHKLPQDSWTSWTRSSLSQLFLS